MGDDGWGRGGDGEGVGEGEVMVGAPPMVIMPGTGQRITPGQAAMLLQAAPRSPKAPPAWGLPPKFPPVMPAGSPRAVGLQPTPDVGGPGVYARRGNEPGPSRPPVRGTVGLVAGGPRGPVPLSAKAEADLVELLARADDEVVSASFHV